MITGNPYCIKNLTEWLRLPTYLLLLLSTRCLAVGTEDISALSASAITVSSGTFDLTKNANDKLDEAFF